MTDTKMKPLSGNDLRILEWAAQFTLNKTDGLLEEPQELAESVIVLAAEVRRLRAELQWWKDEMWRLDPDSPGQAQKIRELMRNQKRLRDALRPMLLDGELGSALNPDAPNDMLLPTPTTVGERRQATALLCEVEGE